MAAAISSIQSSGAGGYAVRTSANLIEVFFKVTPSGSYASGGDTLDLTVLNSLVPGLDPVKTTALPLQVQLQSAGSTHSGYLYSYAPGTTLANGKFQVIETGAAVSGPFAQLAAGAYPAAVTGDTITGYAVFLRA